MIYVGARSAFGRVAAVVHAQQCTEDFENVLGDKGDSLLESGRNCELNFAKRAFWVIRI